MDRNLAQLLSEWSAQETILLVGLVIVAFLLGFLVSWWLNSSKFRMLTLEAKEKSAALTASIAERTKIADELLLRQADLSRMNFELEESQAAQRYLEDTKSQLQQSLDNARRDFEKADTAATQFRNTIEDLNDQIIGLKNQNALLLGQQENQIPAQSTDFEKSSEASRSLIGTFAEGRLSEIEQRLRRLEQSKDQNRPPKTDPPAGSRSLMDMQETTAPTIDDEAEEVLFSPIHFTLQEPPASQRAAIFADDLKRIEGIGPFLEKKLNEIGVYSFQDIQNWDENRIAEVTHEIGFFEGRIQKDDWVGQAQRLAQAPPTHQAATPPSTMPDDLKIIEGIGPTIEEILHKAGILTFEALAKSEPEEIETIIQIAGPHLHFINASTWPAQARLALNKEWEILRDYQDQLIAGRPTRDEDEG